MIKRFFFIGFFFCALVFSCHKIHAQTNVNEAVLVAQVQNSSFGIMSRLDAIEKLSFHFNKIIGSAEKADSTATYGIALAGATKNPAAQLRAYQIYFDELSTDIAPVKSGNLIDDYLMLAKNQQEERHIAFALIAKSKLQVWTFAKKEALKSAHEALAHAEKSGDLSAIIKATNQLAIACNNAGDNVSALRYHLAALEHIYKYPKVDYRLHFSTLIDFSVFYINNEIFEKARYYNELAHQALENYSNVDPFYFYEGLIFSLQIEVGDPKGQINPVLLENYIKQTKELGYMAVYRDLWAMYRSFLIRNEQYQKLYEVYMINHPEELKHIEKDSPNVYWRLKAFFFELDGEIDSAQYYWNKTLAYGEKQPNVFLRSHLYIRAGQFNNRVSDLKKARVYLQKGFDISSQANYFPFMMEALDGLEELDLREGAYESAHKHVSLKKALSDSLDRMNQEKKLLALEFEHTALMLKNDRERELQEQARKLEDQARITLYFGIGAGLFMILSALIFYSYRQTRRERKLSESLLLNILPADTATELKANGTTTAKAYTNVTILFADIIGFSIVAEKLDATTLVAELDAYFRQFDHIMQKHGLEKIKTVGDAYIAVAGLPNDNKATAIDMMNAAIDMQAFVIQMSQTRKKEGKPYFELRIGLHTGSVVAGVVGFKKFQFDIWGDAVNIAARMEQSSAAGKINVSEDTYGQLKNEFKFIHRGKILAKNKGELSMYFYVDDEYEVADA